ncbi:MAG: DUF6448 family protein [Actinomycetota bacterium]
MTRQVQVEVADRFEAMLRAKQHVSEDVDAGRKYVEAMLGPSGLVPQAVRVHQGAAHEGLTSTDR